MEILKDNPIKLKGENEELLTINKRLSNRLWRLNNLYFIKNADGVVVKFKMNDIQKELFKNIWYLNIILKARQEGISTFLNIYFLDACLFNMNKSAGVICDTLSNAKIFLSEKIKFAYDNLDNYIKNIVKMVAYSKSADNAGIWFSNGSSVRVGTSFRSGSLQYLHISELARISKVSPEKAQEIQTGALNTIQVGQQLFIESTAEGSTGLFYDMAKKAEDLKIEKAILTKMDYKFHFFSWHEDSKYKMDKPNSFCFSKSSAKYFDDLEKERGIVLSTEQKFWYVKKLESQGISMMKEFPSYSKEAFLASSKASYWGNILNSLRTKGNVSEFAIETSLDVNTAWDLGIGRDAMSIWFFQVFGKEIRIIDYLEEHGEGFSYYARALKDKGYNYGKHFAPFDIVVKEMGTGTTRLESAENAGIYFERREDKENRVQSVLPKLSLEEGRDLVRLILPNCYFKKSTTARGLECLEKYSKKWNETLGGWADQKKDEYEQGASSFRYLATSLPILGLTDPREEEKGQYERARKLPTPNNPNFER